MLITFRRAAICQSVAEVQLTGVAPLGTVSHRLNFLITCETTEQILKAYSSEKLTENSSIKETTNLETWKMLPLYYAQ